MSKEAKEPISIVRTGKGKFEIRALGNPHSVVIGRAEKRMLFLDGAEIEELGLDIAGVLRSVIEIKPRT